jgi:Flp pilus assembly protein TadG
MKRVAKMVSVLRVEAYRQLDKLRRDEKGAQAIEWVLLALVVIGLMAGITEYFQGEGNTEGLAKALLQKLQKWVEEL